MSIQFSADEIFEMAEQIERNGAKFYRKAAGSVDSAEAKKLLEELAIWEEGHEKIFAEMRQQLTERERMPMTFDPEDESGLYLQALADGHVFNVKADPSEELTGSESLKDILLSAIGKEKDSIVFYLGMRDVAPEKFGRERVDQIIGEEKGHIAMLSEQIRCL